MDGWGCNDGAGIVEANGRRYFCYCLPREIAAYHKLERIAALGGLSPSPEATDRKLKWLACFVVAHAHGADVREVAALAGLTY